MTISSARKISDENVTSVLEIKVLDHAKNLPLPAYATDLAAGFDVLAAVDAPVIMAPQDITLIPTGLCMALPAGFEAQVRPRSGLAAKNGITVLNSPGTIDADYRGEVKVILINHSKTPFTVERGMRIAQIVIAKHERVELCAVETLSETTRGAGGFGSTGVK